MGNPWRALPRTLPFVIGEDAPAIAKFNQSANESARLHLELIPEPFIGDPCSPVVLLSLNPGFSPQDPMWHADPAFAEAARANLEHKASNYPFFLLNPTIKAPGNKWWSRRLSRLVKLFGLEQVARRVLCVEYLGYHSIKFSHHQLRLASQEYGFFLVRQALLRGATVVLTRGRRYWLEVIPELRRSDRVHSLQSVQNTTLSPRNCPTGFDQIVAALRS
jgi:hypothetical protein